MYEGVQTLREGLRAASDIPAQIRTLYYYRTELASIQALYQAYEADPPSATDEQIFLYGFLNGLYGSTPVTTDIFDMIDDTAGIADWPTDHAELLATPDTP